MPAEGLRILMEPLHLNQIRSVAFQHFEIDLPPGFNEVFPATLHDKGILGYEYAKQEEKENTKQKNINRI